MFSTINLDLSRHIAANNGPPIISEDLKRCLDLYKIHDFPSILRELQFLVNHYGDIGKVGELLSKNQFILCEHMDVVWTYLDIQDSWIRQCYFDTKACYLKQLRDNLEFLNIYHYYENLEPFVLLDNAFDVEAPLKDLKESSPLAWVNDKPVTLLHTKLHKNSQEILGHLPNYFSCMGYNFTKVKGKVCLRDTCGLSLYKSAEFDFSEDGLYLNSQNIKLLNFNTLYHKKQVKVLKDKGSLEELAKDIGIAVENNVVKEHLTINPAEVIFNLFNDTQRDKIYPLLGNRTAFKAVVDLFSIV